MGIGAGAAGFADVGAAWLAGARVADSWIPGGAGALIAEDGAGAVDAIGLDFAVGAVVGAGAGLAGGAGVALAFPTSAAWARAEAVALALLARSEYVCVYADSIPSLDSPKIPMHVV